MDWVTLIVALCTSGGILYLVIEKIFNHRQDKANAQATVISNSNEIAELYSKIDEIVESKVAVVENKAMQKLEQITNELKETNDELRDIKEHWCCYREKCKERIMMKPANNE